MTDNAFDLPNPVIPADSRQMLLTVAESWDSPQARLYLCEKDRGEWQVKKSFDAVCGQNGMAWGLGIYPAGLGQRPVSGKQEGDRKAPAGIFRLGVAMGYAPKPEVNVRWPYRQSTAALLGIDDPDSHYYNKIVNPADLAGTDWKSSEIMRRGDDLYKWLVVIDHNPDNLPGAGSLIFLHLWQDQNTGTAGCTASSEAAISEILAWLDPEHRPILVQLPREVYRECQTEWGLPHLC